MSNLGSVVKLAKPTAETDRKSSLNALPLPHAFQAQAVEQISAALSEAIAAIDAGLLAYADSGCTRDEQNLALQARGELLDHQQAVLAEVRLQLHEGFKQLSTGCLSPAQSGPLTFSGEWSLVDEADYELDLLIADIGRSIRSAAADALSPLTPTVLAQYLHQGCRVFDRESGVQSYILRQMEQHFADAIQSRYIELNDFLVERGVMPALPKVVAKPKKQENFDGRNMRSGTSQAHGDVPMVPLTDALASALAAMPGNGAGSAIGGQYNLHSFIAGHEQELLNALQRLLVINSTAPLTGGASLAAGIDPLTPVRTADASPLVTAGNLGQQFLDSLNVLQSGETEGAIETLGELDVESLRSGRANILHQIKTTDLGAAMGHYDVMTVDIVAMLFDHVFDDPAIPSAMKALIGRLQIPVLKVAMLDTRFFARKQHPARRLLHVLSQAALDWRVEDGEDKLFKQIAGAVDRIVHDFDENVALFESELVALEAYMASSAECAAEESAEKAHDLAKAERHELAQAMASQLIEERCCSPDLNPLLIEFLREQWHPVLVSAAANDQDADSEWRAVVGIMDDLLWSVAPKSGADSRAKLVNMLPGLLRSLGEHVDAVGIAPAKRDAFIASLVKIHTAAIRNGIKPSAPAVEVVAAPELTSAAETLPSVVMAPLPEVEVTEAEAGPLADLPPIPERLPGSSLTEAAFDLSSVRWDEGISKYQRYEDVVASQLRRGVWVMFTDESGEQMNARLTWVSPRRSRFLFTNRQGKNSIEFTLQALLERFRNETAAFVDAAPSVERAVNDMLERVQLMTA
ncbi:DUF1631 domain-containing protein [Burkholderiaceae bacterium DAT-1]|nr:DUF1631 domain-containing protein [Burkholderiaceae bacterium DAT-1]